MNNINNIIDYIQQNVTSTCKIYIGTDSKRYRREGIWYAKYATAVVIHKESKHGCKVFILQSIERDYDSKRARPINRMMAETYKTSEVFEQLKPYLDTKHVEIHLDINPDEQFGSSCALQQAVGYIKGVCDITPKVKPFALAASFAADHHL